MSDGNDRIPPMRNTLHANLGHGGYRHEYEDGLGNRCTSVKPARNQPERTFWTHDLLPDQKFPNYPTMNAVLLTLTREQIEAEQGKYPHIGTVARDECGNACRLCPRQPFTGERVKHETWRFSVMTSWQGAWHASLCETHSQEFTGEPDALLAALKAEVAERKVRAAGNALLRAIERAAQGAQEGS